MYCEVSTLHKNNHFDSFRLCYVDVIGVDYTYVFEYLIMARNVKINFSDLVHNQFYYLSAMLIERNFIG